MKFPAQSSQAVGGSAEDLSASRRRKKGKRVKNDSAGVFWRFLRLKAAGQLGQKAGKLEKKIKKLKYKISAS